MVILCCVIVRRVRRAVQNAECIAAGVGTAELASMCVTVRDSGCGDIPHERHCQVARSEVRRQKLRGATQMAVLGGDAVFPLRRQGRAPRLPVGSMRRGEVTAEIEGKTGQAW